MPTLAATDNLRVRHVDLASGTVTNLAGRRTVTVLLTPGARRALRRATRPLAIELRVSASGTGQRVTVRTLRATVR